MAKFWGVVGMAAAIGWLISMLLYIHQAEAGVTCTSTRVGNTTYTYCTGQ